MQVWYHLIITWWVIAMRREILLLVLLPQTWNLGLQWREPWSVQYESAKSALRVRLVLADPLTDGHTGKQIFGNPRPHRDHRVFDLGHQCTEFVIAPESLQARVAKPQAEPGPTRVESLAEISVRYSVFSPDGVHGRKVIVPAPLEGPRTPELAISSS